jgi:hypothetical protein
MTDKARSRERVSPAENKRVTMAGGPRIGAQKAASPMLRKSMKQAADKAARKAGRTVTLSVTLPKGSRGEVARLAIHSVLGRVAAVPEREATRILAEARDAAAPEARVMSWLRVEDHGVEPAGRAETALDAAFRRGDARRAAILRDPAMLTGEAAAVRLGVSRETINKRSQQGRLLALEFAKRGKRYPEWQFEERVAGRPLEGVLAAFGSRDAWEQYRFFTQVQPGLGGRTPIEALRRGEVDAVKSSAEAWAAGAQGGG